MVFSLTRHSFKTKRKPRGVVASGDQSGAEDPSGHNLIYLSQSNKMRTSAAVFGLILVGMLSGCYAQQPKQQEQQLSPAVKAAIAAALGPHVSDADETEFLRSAKLASRTKHDAEMVGMLDDLVSLVRSAAQDEYRAERYRQAAKSAQNAVGWNEEMHSKDKTFCAAATDADAVRDCTEEEKRISAQRNEARSNAEAAQGYEDESRKKKERAADLVQELRAELK